jgi:hypothetical protein
MSCEDFRAAECRCNEVVVVDRLDPIGPAEPTTSASRVGRNTSTSRPSLVSPRGETGRFMLKPIGTMGPRAQVPIPLTQSERSSESVSLRGCYTNGRVGAHAAPKGERSRPSCRPRRSPRSTLESTAAEDVELAEPSVDQRGNLKFARSRQADLSCSSAGERIGAHLVPRPERGQCDPSEHHREREIHRPHRADVPGDNRSDAVVESEVPASPIGRLRERAIHPRGPGRSRSCVHVPRVGAQR